MKKLIVVLNLLLISSVVLARGSGHPHNERKDSPSSVVKPCMINVGKELYINANNLTTIKRSSYYSDNVEYRFGYAEQNVRMNDKSEVASEIERVIKEIEEKCN